jgi:methyl coenzyme M reductase system subunit A2
MKSEREMSEKEPFIKISDVCKEFDGKEVLKNVSVVINEGEPLGLLGRSGAGKSVLLHMLRGTEEYEPTRGEVIFRVAVCPHYLEVEGMSEGVHPPIGSLEPPSKVGAVCPMCGSTLELREVNYWKDQDARKRIKRRVAIMLQRTVGLYGEDTVMYNVLQALETRNYPVDQRFRRAYELLKAVKMAHRITFPADMLSDGEKQRVVLVRQLALDPFVLLADEPTGTLDMKTGKLVHKALRESTKGGMTLIVTSHWPSVIEELTDKALWLDNGEVVAYGDSKTVVETFEKQIEEIGRKERVKVGEPKIQIRRLQEVLLFWMAQDGKGGG